jgi:hypothetical protein
MGILKKLNVAGVGLALAMVFGIDVEAAPIVTYLPAGVSSSDGVIVKTGVYRRTARRTTRRAVRRRVY